MSDSGTRIVVDEIADASIRPDQRSGASRWRWIIGLAISAIFLWVAFRQVESVSQITSELGAARYWWLFPAVLFYLAGLAVRAVRWKTLMVPVAIVSYRSIFGILSIGFLVNNVLPARLGEIARAFLIGRQHGVSRSGALATIVVERIFDGIVMLLFLGVATAVAGSRIAAESTWFGYLVPLTGAAFGGASIVLAVLALAPNFALGIAARLLAPFPGRARESALQIAAKFISGLGVLQDLKLAGSVLLTSIIAWLLEAGTYFTVGQAFGLMTNPVPYLLTLSVANLGTMIPSSPGYVGTFEALITHSLKIFEVADAKALAYAIILHLSIWLPPTLIGFFYLWRYNLSLSRLTQEK